MATSARAGRGSDSPARLMAYAISLGLRSKGGGPLSPGKSSIVGEWRIKEIAWP